MSPADLLLRLRARGVLLRRRGESITFDAPAGALLPEDREALRCAKGAVMALLEAEEVGKALDALPAASPEAPALLAALEDALRRGGEPTVPAVLPAPPVGGGCPGCLAGVGEAHHPQCPRTGAAGKAEAEPAAGETYAGLQDPAEAPAVRVTGTESSSGTGRSKPWPSTRARPGFPRRWRRPSRISRPSCPWRGRRSS